MIWLMKWGLTLQLRNGFNWFVTILIVFNTSLGVWSSSNGWCWVVPRSIFPTAPLSGWAAFPARPHSTFGAERSRTGGKGGNYIFRRHVSPRNESKLTAIPFLIFLIFVYLFLPPKNPVQDNHSQSSMVISPWEGQQLEGHEVCRMRVVGEGLPLPWSPMKKSL